jgi:hypothetical protein
MRGVQVGPDSGREDKRPSLSMPADEGVDQISVKVDFDLDEASPVTEFEGKHRRGVLGSYGRPCAQGR